MGAARIFHITEPALWDDAHATGRYQWSTRGATLVEVGFIHCSFREQVEPVANLVYPDHRGDLIALAIDPDRVDAEIRVENLDGGDQHFPHIYGPLDVDAVIAVQELHRDDARRWRLTDPS